MAGALPTIRNVTTVALYPVTRGNQFSTGVLQFMNGSEQRFSRSASLATFVLAYTGLFAIDRDLLKAFVASQKGSFDSTWTFALPTSTLGTIPTPGTAGYYGNLTFEEDAFSAVEGNRPNLYDVTLKFRQTISSGAIAGAGGASYPTLSTGATTQRPYTQAPTSLTTRSDIDAGKRYAYPWYGGGLTGFPTRPLLSWILAYPAITDADLATLEGFFVLNAGRLGQFSFTDPEDSVVYTKCRFDMDTFEARMLGPNQCATTVRIQEFF